MRALLGQGVPVHLMISSKQRGIYPLALIVLHSETVHSHYLQCTEIAFWQTLAHNLSLNLAGTFIDFNDMLGCAIVDFQILSCLLDCETLIFYCPDQLSSLIKFNRHVASLSPEKFLLKNWHSFGRVGELEVMEILTVVHVA